MTPCVHLVKILSNETARCKWGQRDLLIRTNSTGTSFKDHLHKSCQEPSGFSLFFFFFLNSLFCFLSSAVVLFFFSVKFYKVKELPDLISLPSLSLCNVIIQGFYLLLHPSPISHPTVWHSAQTMAHFHHPAKTCCLVLLSGKAVGKDSSSLLHILHTSPPPTQ